MPEKFPIYRRIVEQQHDDMADTSHCRNACPVLPHLPTDGNQIIKGLWTPFPFISNTTPWTVALPACAW